jgi:DNA-binding GntR family transcriptional regulator
MSDATPAMIAPLTRPPGVTELTIVAFRQVIIAGDLGAGAVIPEALWAHRLGVSRVPVREALDRLERDGLVSIDRRGRAVVRTLTRRDLWETLSLRQALEGLGVREACRSPANVRTGAFATNLREAARARDPQECARLDVEFHGLLIAASGHRRLLDAWDGIRWPYLAILSRVYRGADAPRLREIRASLAVHARIHRAVAAGDAKLAAERLTDHLNEWSDWDEEVTRVLPESDAAG